MILRWLHNVPDFPDIIMHLSNVLLLHIQAHLPLFHDSNLRKSQV